MSFRVHQPEPQEVVVEISQDDQDVNIFLNDLLVGWFDEDTHKLTLQKILKPEQESLADFIDFDDEGFIKIHRALA